MPPDELQQTSSRSGKSRPPLHHPEKTGGTKLKLRRLSAEDSALQQEQGRSAAGANPAPEKTAGEEPPSLVLDLERQLLPRSSHSQQHDPAPVNTSAENDGKGKSQQWVQMEIPKFDDDDDAVVLKPGILGSRHDSESFASVREYKDRLKFLRKLADKVVGTTSTAAGLSRDELHDRATVAAEVLNRMKKWRTNAFADFGSKVMTKTLFDDMAQPLVLAEARYRVSYKRRLQE